MKFHLISSVPIASGRARPGDVRAGHAAMTALRWALGSSPDWQLALARAVAAPPAGVTFRQPWPVAPGLDCPA
ncbi:MAG TPA: hypothetical protein VMH35_28975 [Streptosporangiaceae bacterium]|nr:hypothetical protein [Streptosporangiaceae bacterium]